MSDTIYLIRHASPPSIGRGRYWGRRDPGVDAESVAGVAPLAELMFPPPERLFASPLSRAILTAERLSSRLGLQVEIVPELAETDFGRFDGLTFAEIERDEPEAALRWGETLDGFVFPGGEAIADFLERAAAAWRTCLAASETAVAAVTHGGVIPVWICLFLGVPLAQRFMFRAEYAALTEFARKRDGSGWEMRCFNNTPH